MTAAAAWREVCGVDADPVIDDRDSQRLVALELRPEHDTPASLGAVDGVAQDVSQCLAAGACASTTWK